jgi:Domain of unknown function (DUF4381)
MAGELPQLRDIHLPAEPGWWPPAPGWWLLALLVLALLLFGLLRLRVRLRQRRRRAQILAELARLRPQALDAADVPAWLAALSAFLRRLSRAVRPDAATLAGADWIRFLDRHGDGFGAYAQALTDGPYRPQAGVDAQRLHALVQGHVHRVLDSELRHV